MAKLPIVVLKAVVSVVPKGEKRAGDGGRGPSPDGLPRIDGEAMVSQVREDNGQASGQSRHVMEKNRAPRSEDVDSNNLAHGL